jgi:hypothetical protein
MTRVSHDERTANPPRLPTEQVLTKRGGRIVISVKSIVSGAILAVVAAMAVGGAMLTPEAYLRSNIVARLAGPDLAHWPRRTGPGYAEPAARRRGHHGERGGGGGCHRVVCWLAA